MAKKKEDTQGITQRGKVNKAQKEILHKDRKKRQEQRKRNRTGIPSGRTASR